jgi:hypothetical protein
MTHENMQRERSQPQKAMHRMNEFLSLSRRGKFMKTESTSAVTRAKKKGEWKGTANGQSG